MFVFAKQIAVLNTIAKKGLVCSLITGLSRYATAMTQVAMQLLRQLSATLQFAELLCFSLQSKCEALCCRKGGSQAAGS